MTSRITVNNIESNSGISSIALDSGVTINRGSGINVSSGILTATTADFSGDVKVGGVLTYEDVTNVDSVGVVTARNGIRVGAGKSIGSDSGTVTYYGDGSNLTNLPTRTQPFRNLVVNGACLAAQRGASSTANGYKTVDRVDPYSVSHNAGTITYSQSDITSGAAWDAGFRNAFKLATSQAGNTTTAACYVSSYVTKLEAQDIANSGWDYTDPTSKVTLSFWIKASTADDFQIQLVTDDGTKKKYNTTVAATTSWTKITKTIPGHADLTFNNDNGLGLTIQLILATGDDMTGTVTQDTWVANTTAQVKSSKVGNTWITAGAGSVEATGFQLEVGDSVTDYDFKPYGEELIRCQRYYNRVFDMNGQSGEKPISLAVYENGSNLTTIFNFPEMRDVPSLDITNGSGKFMIRRQDGSDSFDTMSMRYGTRTTAELTIGSNVSGNSGVVGMLRGAASDTYIAFSAEL